MEAVFVGRARAYNRRFLQLCSHHLVEPVACTPAAGWEKGQVENQVGTMRDVLFRPKPKVTSLEELNAWLAEQCVAYAKRTSIRSSGIERSLKCSRKSGRASCPSSALSPGSSRSQCARRRRA